MAQESGCKTALALLLGELSPNMHNKKKPSCTQGASIHNHSEASGSGKINILLSLCQCSLNTQLCLKSFTEESGLSYWHALHITGSYQLITHTGVKTLFYASSLFIYGKTKLKCDVIHGGDAEDEYMRFTCIYWGSSSDLNSSSYSYFSCLLIVSLIIWSTK